MTAILATDFPVARAVGKLESAITDSIPMMETGRAETATDCNDRPTNLESTTGAAMAGGAMANSKPGGRTLLIKHVEQQLVISASPSGQPATTGALAKRAKSKVASNGMTYADWLTRAIQSTTDCRLTLAEIYDWMVLNVPGLSGQRYLHSSKGWKNAVRHTLSVNARFCKIARPGRPSYWAVAPSVNAPISETVAGNIDAANRKRRSRTTSSPAPIPAEEIAASPKRLKTLPSPSATDPDSRSDVSTTSVTPPARTPQAAAPAASTSAAQTSDVVAPCYTIDYYQIPLALLAVAATAKQIFTPKPSSNFRTSPTSAFVSFLPRQEAKG